MLDCRHHIRSSCGLLWEGEDGFLWVRWTDADPEWTPRDPDAPSRDYRVRARDDYDYVFEAIDPETGEVVATRRFDGPLLAAPFSRLLASYADLPLTEIGLDIWTIRVQRE